MSRQIQEYRENNEEIYWIDNAFGGMPTYQLGARYPYDFLTPIHKLIQLIPQPAEILFLYLLSAYLFLLIIKMPIPIAVFGAFAYGLSTYLLIILQVGHNTKAQAMAYMPLVIGGMYMILTIIVLEALSLPFSLCPCRFEPIITKWPIICFCWCWSLELFMQFMH